MNENRTPCRIWIAFPITLLLITMLSCKKSSEIPQADLTGSSVSIYEDLPSGNLTVPVTLAGTSDRTVTISYQTEDSTATAGKDYTSSSGIVTISAGQTSASINLHILKDTAVKQDVVFKVIFSDPVNCKLNGSFTAVRIVNTDYANLVWSDEFSSSPLSTASWNYELGNNSGWGNNELETYTSSTDNVHIDTGYLHITAISGSSPQYTSGRITTKGKKEFTHCRVDIRAMLPEGKGLWPALWMLGGNISTAGWPACGETDIMELLGDNTTQVYGTIHWNDNGYTHRGSSMSLSSGSFSNSFHVFSLIWGPNHLQWLVDNTPYQTINRSDISAFPFDLPQFLIFNVAVGGNWPGAPDGSTVFPQNMIIDYVRVYQ
ncbi:MAG TPA: family 16 glycosylhydrolase [Bacteroidales bacterium]|nr:family 16 glycosylhydrolase [Bacteroidales bacterium]